MDFREHQDRAKRNSKIIWLLYILLLSISSFLIAWTFMLGIEVYLIDYAREYAEYSFWQQLLISNTHVFNEKIKVLFAYFIVTLIIQALTGLSFFKKSSGYQIAATFDARRLNENTVKSFKEKQALNIVAEQALAASVPIPSLYLIPEQGINAFAAGKSNENAVVAITEGALNHFDRTQLSGVIAHEIGHIVNQDIRLNIQISAFALSFTALFCLARFIFESATHNRRLDIRARLIMFVVAGIIAVIGSLTVWFGRILQAAMSRQREYLADASAVQFTRYPQGLVEALKVIAFQDKSTKMRSFSSKEYAHAMMFDVGGELFSTHPPLMERINRILDIE